MNLPKSNKRIIIFPIIALICSSANFIIVFLSFICSKIDIPIFNTFNIILWSILVATGLGAYFQLVGIKLAVISLCINRKQAGKTELIFSVVSILIPFVWWGIVYILYLQGTVYFY